LVTMEKVRVISYRAENDVAPSPVT